MNPLRALTNLNGSTNKLYNFVTCSHEWQINIAPLNLSPVVPSIITQSRAILRERLMKYAYYYQFPFRARSGLSQLLEEIDIITIPKRRGFEKLTHFVQDDYDAVL